MRYKMAPIQLSWHGVRVKFIYSDGQGRLVQCVHSSVQLDMTEQLRSDPKYSGTVKLSVQNIRSQSFIIPNSQSILPYPPPLALCLLTIHQSLVTPVRPELLGWYASSEMKLLSVAVTSVVSNSANLQTGSPSCWDSPGKNTDKAFPFSIMSPEREKWKWSPLSCPTLSCI